MSNYDYVEKIWIDVRVGYASNNFELITAWIAIQRPEYRVYQVKGTKDMMVGFTSKHDAMVFKLMFGQGPFTEKM